MFDRYATRKWMLRNLKTLINELDFYRDNYKDFKDLPRFALVKLDEESGKIVL